MADEQNFSPEFKAKRVLEILKGKSVAEVSREHGIKESTLESWHKHALENAEQIFSSEPSPEEKKIAELERTVDKLTRDLELSKKIKRALEEMGYIDRS